MILSVEEHNQIATRLYEKEEFSEINDAAVYSVLRR